MKRTSPPRSARRPGSATPALTPLRLSPGAAAVLASALAWMLVLGGAAWGLHLLDGVARAAQARQTAVLRWAELPPWLSAPEQAAVLAEIAAAANVPPEADLHAPDLCERVAAALSACPWIERVERVTKQADGVVRVAAQFRRPAAMVARGTTAHLVSESGVRLPREVSVEEAPRYHFLVIVGARAAPPAVGEVWPGEDVKAGVALARFIDEAAAAGHASMRSSLRMIDVKQVGRLSEPGGGAMVLLTDQPESRILWGLPPGAEYDVERSAADKLRALNAIHASEGRWPAGRWYDVRPHERVLKGEVQ